MLRAKVGLAQAVFPQETLCLDGAMPAGWPLWPPWWRLCWCRGPRRRRR